MNKCSRTGLSLGNLIGASLAWGLEPVVGSTVKWTDPAGCIVHGVPKAWKGVHRALEEEEVIHGRKGWPKEVGHICSSSLRDS